MNHKDTINNLIDTIKIQNTDETQAVQLSGDKLEGRFNGNANSRQNLSAVFTYTMELEGTFSANYIEAVANNLRNSYANGFATFCSIY